MGAATVVAYTEADGHLGTLDPPPLIGSLDAFPRPACLSLIAKLERIAAAGAARAVGFIEDGHAEGVLIVWCRHGRRIYCVLCALVDHTHLVHDSGRNASSTALVLLHAAACDQPAPRAGEHIPRPVSGGSPFSRTGFLSAAAPKHDAPVGDADASLDPTLTARSVVAALPEADQRLAADRLTRFRHSPERHGWV
jgi:hypothetical protein